MDAQQPTDSVLHDPEAVRAKIEVVIAQVLDRRDRGELVSDQAVLAEHPQLMPELGRRLEKLSMIHRARLAARRAAPVDQPLLPLLQAELDQPIVLPEDEGTEDDAAPSLCVRGYYILDEISRGGQGAVFKAIHEATGRKVAIKLMPGGWLMSSKHRARFDREAQILATLAHPNIVGILDRGRTADGSFFLAMEYIDGYCLDDYWMECIARDAAGLERVLRLFAAIGEAVEEAHGQGIVHRDLKPSNVRVDRWGKPHVLDFGLARSAVGSNGEREATLTATGQILGSLPWTSPEQVRGQFLSPRSDVYSLGVMLYQALTGEFPYTTCGSVEEVITHIVSAAVAPPSRKVRFRQARNRKALDAIVLKALAKRPEQRYASSGEFSRELLCYLEGRPVTASLRLRQRRRFIALVIATALAVAVGTTAAWRILHHDHLPASPTVIELPGFTNSIGMRFVKVPPGAVLIGSPPDEPGRDPSERLTQVIIGRPLYVGVTEVTQRQYEAIMGSNPSARPWRGEDLPAQNLAWAQAVEFCRRLSQRESRSYRLPTDGEWEYACRAGSRTAFAGNGDLNSMGWYDGNSDKMLHPVGQKFPNHWGIYDMSGGVAEWCLDAPNLGPSTAPSIQTSNRRSIRGGSALRPARECRSAARLVVPADVPSKDVGFRAVMEEDRPAH